MIEKGTLVTFPLGFETRAHGRIERGPYEAPEDFKKQQLNDFSVVVKTVYDIRAAGIGLVTISSRFVRRVR